MMRGMFQSPLSHPFLNPLVVALDVDSREEAVHLAQQLTGVVGGFKLGPRLCLRYGQRLIEEIAAFGPVFMDNKHFDISSTMEAAVRASFDCGASVVTVHALAGFEALQVLAQVESELNQRRPFRILAVTVLTSWNEASMPPSLKTQSVSQHVVELAELVKKAGLTGLVCSPHELTLLGKQNDLYVLTPGIRFPGEEAGDQKRIAGPGEALGAGSRALVVGRPIVRARDPRGIAEKYLRTVQLEMEMIDG